MLIKASKQSKENMCVALYNRILHENNICPANHEVFYSHGWFYVDDHKPVHNTTLTQEAERLLAKGVTVYYSPTYNSFVLRD